LLVASVVDVVVVGPSLAAGLVRVSAVVLVSLTGLCPVLLPLHRSEDSASLPLSFPEGMVLCKLGRELRMSPRYFRRNTDLMLLQFHVLSDLGRTRSGVC